jgi:low affinity Fe/Cu permease
MNAAFTRIASGSAHWMGKPIAFIVACLVCIAWAISGPFFHYSDTWQLVINTGTTVLTFLMVFLIQNSQNRDGAAIQCKLDELIRVNAQARDSLIGIEEQTEEAIEEAKRDDHHH